MKVFIGRYPSTRVLARNPAAEQVKRIRIDSWDTWNMAETLADIIVPMLTQLRDECHGSPGGIQYFSEVSTNNFDGQEYFDWYKDDDDRARDLGHKYWRDCLEKMIWSFEQIQQFDRDHQFHIVKDGKKMFDKVAYKVYYDKIQDGLNLFAKHYLGLWD